MANRIQTRAAFRNWYKRNKDEFNAKRRARYHEDPQHREAILTKQKEDRPLREKKKPETDGHTYKKVGNKTVEVVRIGQVALEIDRDQQVVRIWERQGKIPRPTIPGGQRYYSLGQLKLLKEFAGVMSEVRYEPKVREERIKAKSGELFAHWKQAASK